MTALASAPFGELIATQFLRLCSIEHNKKNWLFYGGDTGAEAGANIYSITETAKANNLRPYRYVEYLLTEIPKLRDDNGKMDDAKLDALMPWSKELPDELRVPRR